jgi:hypothetical protein
LNLLSEKLVSSLCFQNATCTATTGDFNAEPGSPLYHFLAAGELDCSHVDRRDMSGCLVEGEGGGDSAWFMMMESGGFDRSEEEWEEWKEDQGGAVHVESS